MPTTNVTFYEPMTRAQREDLGQLANIYYIDEGHDGSRYKLVCNGDNAGAVEDLLVEYDETAQMSPDWKWDN